MRPAVPSPPYISATVGSRRPVQRFWQRTWVRASHLCGSQSATRDTATRSSGPCHTHLQDARSPTPCHSSQASSIWRHWRDRTWTYAMQAVILTQLPSDRHRARRLQTWETSGTWETSFGTSATSLQTAAEASHQGFASNSSFTISKDSESLCRAPHCFHLPLALWCPSDHRGQKPGSHSEQCNNWFSLPPQKPAGQCRRKMAACCCRMGVSAGLSKLM